MELAIKTYGMEPVERLLDILIVDDNPGDVELIREIFRMSPLRKNLHVVSDGEQALDFLYRRGAHTGAPRPDFILLDLNLPRRDGRQVLAEIKDDPGLQDIPVVVFTTSQAEEDVQTSYINHINCFITKPIDLDEYIDRLQAVERFWLARLHKEKNRGSVNG